MKLSVNILVSELEKFFKDISINKKYKTDDLAVLPTPRLYLNPVVLQKNNIYILSPDFVPVQEKVDGPCLLIIPDDSQKVIPCKNLSIIRIKNSDVPQIFNTVIEIYEKFRDWSDELIEMSFNSAPIDDYLKHGFSLLNNSINVHDSSFNYLSRYGNNNTYKDLHTLNFIDPDFLMRVDNYVNHELFKSRDTIYFRDESNGKEYYFQNIFNGNTVIARLMVTNDNRQFMPADKLIISLLGKYISSELSYTMFKGSGKNFRRDSLLDYLSGKNHKDEQIIMLKTISPFGRLKENQRLFIMTGICLDSILTEQYIAFQIERAIPESVCVLFEGKIVLLCSNEENQTIPDLFNQVEKIFNKYSVKAGCSNAFTDFYNLKFCYRQADFTFKCVENRSDTPRLNHFKDYTLEHFMQYGISEMPIEMLCASCILKLYDHDREASVSYCESLRVYLNSGMNATETSRILGITRNTFLARLERILKFIDLDIENENNRLYLQISLKLLLEK